MFTIRYHLWILLLSLFVPSAIYGQEVRDLAHANGILFGSPIYDLELQGHEQLYRDQINVATIMAYWKYTTHNSEGAFTWDEPDAAIALAESMGAETHGHPLVWGSDTHIPDWVLAKPLEQAEGIMLDHISTVAGRYAGRMDLWDVVNEAIEDDGSYRDSYWNRAMTGDFIIKAFNRAHETDPAAGLIYNDYGMETNRPKFETIKDLLGWIQSEDVGLSGLGWQLHVHVDDVLDIDFPLAEYMNEISAMGLHNYITELDIRIPNDSEVELNKQKEAYKKITSIFLNNVTHGKYLQTWGLSDINTWWNDFDPSQTHYPLPFDRQFEKKPAYWGIYEALSEHLGAGSNLSGEFRIRNKWTGTYLTLGGVNDGTPVELTSSSGAMSQQWEVGYATGQFQRIRADGQDLYLNTGDTVNNTSVHTYALHADWWSQMWYAEPVGDGTYRIKHRWSQKYLNAKENGEVCIHSLNAGWDSQIWIFEEIGGECLPNFTMSEDVSSGENKVVRTSDWIRASAAVNGGGQLKLQAENEVILESGFMVHVGANMQATIQECDDSGTGDPNVDVGLSNPGANAKTRSIYQYLKTLKSDPGQCLIAGQNLGWSFEKFDQTVQGLKNETGVFPGVIGGQMRWAPDEINYSDLVQLYSNWQSEGGLVELSLLPDNPWTGGDSWDRSETNIWMLTTPGQEGYLAWREQLDFYAGILKDMENAGVTVLFRPLMEMNGDWFWYGFAGENDPQHFVNLYRDMYDYFTNTWQLNNLIWVYSANMAYDGIPAVDHYFPGADVVDVTGLDVYANGLSLPPAQYQSMTALGKPFAITEFGPDHNNMNGSHDYLAFTNKILSDFPAAIYCLAWHDWPDHKVSWIENQNYNSALNLPCIVSREELSQHLETRLQVRQTETSDGERR